MEPNPTPPNPASHPSSVTRRAAPEAAKPGSSVVAQSLPAPEPGDESPTIISLNRPRNPSAEAAEGLQGKKLGHFELLEPIGVGGMAAVIRAHDLQLGRIVALKILPPEMAADPENITRFKQEARSAAKLDHENIARVYFFGEDQGLHFIAFEYVEGVDLRTLMARGGPLQPAPAVRYMLQIAAGLAHAASRGVTHRDIKPSNVIITPEGRAKIVDMGLARSADVVGGVTQSGMTLGTFDYISPEQAIEPRSADVRSDIYSLGCTFYHLLTGQPPVPEGTAAKKLHHHQHVPPVDPRELNPAIPDELAAVLGRMMAKEPRDRYQRPEQLIQHLMAVMHKFELPGGGSGQETVLFVDAPLPQPPRFSPVLAAVVAIAIVALLAVVLGTGGRTDLTPQSFPIARRTGDDAAFAAQPSGPPMFNGAERPAEKEPKPAASVEDLARLLQDPKAETILLTGDDYNLAELARPDSGDERSPRPLTVARSVKLVGKPRPDGTRPLIRWKVEGGSARDADLALGLLNVLGGSPGVQIELQHLRFDVKAADSNAPVYAVVSQGAARLRAFDCEFSHKGKSEEGAYGGAIRFEGTGPTPALLDLDRCYFTGGACAADVSNRGTVKARQCAFGPHSVLFVFREKSVPAAANPERPLADLSHCTVLMRDGTIFQAEANVTGTIRAANCVFGKGQESGEVVLVRQQDRGDRQKVIFAGAADGQSARNVYSGLVYWADPLPCAPTLAECRRRGLPFLDEGAIELLRDRGPWKNMQPLALLDNPREAFALATNRPELRTLARPDAMVGVEQIGATNSDLYAGALPPAGEEPAGGLNERIVEPGKANDERLHRYGSLSAALEDAPAGDLTLLIRHTGPLAVAPQTLSRPNMRITIKPDGAHRPVLTLGDTDTLNPSMFMLRNGSVTFKDMQFRLKPAPDDDSKWLSVVTITGLGQCGFENCTATMDTNDDTQPVLVTLTSDPDAGAGAEKRLPKVRLNDCFLRGRGHAVAVRGSRPFELEADDVLAALNGSFVVIVGQGREPPLAPQAQFAFRHTTAYLSEPFLELRSAEGEKKVAGLVPMQVRCEDCLLVAAGDRSLVHATGVDRDTLTKTLLTWEGNRNVYGNFQKMLDVKVIGTMMPMMASEWTARDWMQFSREGDDAFARVNFARTPGEDRPFTKVLPGDFRAKLSDMKRTDVSAATFGAQLGQLPKVDDE